MKNIVKGYLIGVLSTVLLLCTVCYAASNTKTIKALYNNIKIYVDGVKIDPKDAIGNTVEPFIYNGTTYLPVRAVGEAIGKTVTWDGTTQSVYLGEKPGQKKYLVEVCDPYRLVCGKLYKSSSGKSFTMSGKKYTNGLSFGGYFYADNAYALFNLDSNYKSLNCDLGYLDLDPVDGLDASKKCTVSFIVDGVNVKEYTVSINDLPKNVTVPINNGMQLKILVSNGKSYLGVGNITMK